MANGLALAVREAGGQEAEELTSDGPVETVPGDARAVFQRRPKAGLTQAKGVKPAYSLWPQGG